MTIGNPLSLKHDVTQLDPANHLISTFQGESTVGGRTWTNHPISTALFDPRESFFACGCFVGDYNQIAVSSEVLLPAWTLEGLAAETRRGLERLDQRGDQVVRDGHARDRGPAVARPPAAGSATERFVTLGRDG